MLSISKKHSSLNLSVLLLSLFTGFFAFGAEKSKTDFETALVLPWKFIQAALQPKSSDNSHFQYQMNNLQFEAQGVPFTVPQAQLDVLMHLKPVVSQQSETLWETDLLSLQINVSGFKIQKDIVQDLGGARIIVHLQAECSPFTLTQAKAQSQMLWDWTVVDRRVSANLKSLALSWEPGSWQVSNLSCTGPIGFADLVQFELQKQLAQADALIPTIKSSLQNTLNQQMGQWLDQWKEPQWMVADKSMSLQLIGSGVVSSKGLLFRALLRMGDTSREVNFDQVNLLNMSEELLQKTSDQPTLIFSKEALQGLIQQKSIWPEYNTSLNKISGFARLLNSRFLQFFVWPDLWKYSKQALFNLNSRLAGTPALQFDQGTRVYVQAPISSWVQSQRDGKSWNYVQLKTDLKTWMNYSVNNGKLTLVPQSPSIKTSAQFGADYVKQFHPSTRFSISLMQAAIEQSQNLQAAQSITIPEFKLSETLKMQAHSLSRPSADHFFMEWAATP